ncbi:hypothetical protein RRG08_023135 [Elysia crispata]|uniref:Uncharacterized protein n=1 Tax=Elysia crispata TaxID=231223 RepID=A0AAE0XN51_9GAST|nr:hypothetical protein RRG08_023135 [Elysia crispata]
MLEFIITRDTHLMDMVTTPQGQPSELAYKVESQPSGLASTKHHSLEVAINVPNCSSDKENSQQQPSEMEPSYSYSYFANATRNNEFQGYHLHLNLHKQRSGKKNLRKQEISLSGPQVCI